MYIDNLQATIKCPVSATFKAINTKKRKNMSFCLRVRPTKIKDLHDFKCVLLHFGKI